MSSLTHFVSSTQGGNMSCHAKKDLIWRDQTDVIPRTHYQYTSRSGTPEKSSCWSKSRKPLFKCLWTLICMIGLVRQIILVTESYSSYTTVTEVAIKYERRFKPPSLSYCLYVSDLMNQTYLKQKAESFGHPEKCIKQEECTERLLINMTHVDSDENQVVTHKQLLEDLTSDTMGRMHPVTISDEKNNHTAEYFLMPRSGYMRMAKCVRLTYNKIDAQIVSIKDTVVMERDISQTEMAKRQLIMKFYTHERRSLPRVNYTLCSWVYTTKPLFVAYRKYQSILIKTPNNFCVDYTKTRFDSRDHCLEECDRLTEYRSCLKRGGDSCSLNAYYQASRLASDLDAPLKVVDFEGECKCPEECAVNYFNPFIVPVYMNGTVILAHVNPTTVVAYSLKLSLLEYIIYVASLSSLWFGFVIFDFLQTMTTKFNVYLTNRKKKQMTTSIIVPVTVTNQVFHGIPANKLSLC